MNIKKIIGTILRYLFLVFFIGAMLAVLYGAKVLSQRLTGKRLYQELVKS